jgi:hypothetical protein
MLKGGAFYKVAMSILRQLRSAHDSITRANVAGFLALLRMVLAPLVERGNERSQARPQWGERIVDALRFLDEKLPIDQALFFERSELLD